MEQQQAVPSFQFAIARARDGGYVISTGTGEDAEFACARSALCEVHEWIGVQLAQGYRESVTRPQMPAVMIPQRPAYQPPPAPPPVTRAMPQDRPVESDSFQAPSFMAEEPALVDRIAAVMGNGKTAAYVALGVLAMSHLLPSIWPFGA